MNQEASAKKLFWYRVKFVTLIAIFISPFVGGWLALYVFEWRPESGNYGELIQPVRKLEWSLMEASDGQRFESGFGRKWAFLQFASEDCAEACQTNLFYMRQIRLLLGRNTERLQNVLVLGGRMNDELRGFLSEYPDMIVIENFRGPALLRQFQIDQEPVGASARLYLVDPDQNLMMYYPPENDQNRVLEDIRKLMKLSQIG